MQVHNRPTIRGKEWSRYRLDKSYISKFDRKYKPKQTKPSEKKIFLVNGKRLEAIVTKGKIESVTEL